LGAQGSPFRRQMLIWKNTSNFQLNENIKVELNLFVNPEIVLAGKLYR
jgi:hypothetical protein